MEWIPQRIDELQVTRDALQEDHKQATSKEQGDLSVMIVHLNMHIDDLIKVQREVMFLPTT